MIGEKGFVGSATSWNGTQDSNWFDPSEDSLEDIFPFPIRHKVRGIWDRYYWLGRLANGSDIVDGKYKYVVTYTQVSPVLPSSLCLFPVSRDDCQVYHVRNNGG